MKHPFSLALLASAYPAIKESAPTFLIIRSVERFLPAQATPPQP